jgi:hypothetical protein
LSRMTNRSDFSDGVGTAAAGVRVGSEEDCVLTSFVEEQAVRAVKTAEAVIILVGKRMTAILLRSCRFSRPQMFLCHQRHMSVHLHINSETPDFRLAFRQPDEEQPKSSTQPWNNRRRMTTGRMSAKAALAQRRMRPPFPG